MNVVLWAVVLFQLAKQAGFIPKIPHQILPSLGQSLLCWCFVRTLLTLSTDLKPLGLFRECWDDTSILLLAPKSRMETMRLCQVEYSRGVSQGLQLHWEAMMNWERTLARPAPHGVLPLKSCERNHRKGRPEGGCCPSHLGPEQGQALWCQCEKRGAPP